MKYTLKAVSLLAALTLSSCNTPDNTTTEPAPIILTEEVEVYNNDLISSNLVLAIENAGLTSYLIDKTGTKHFTWDFDTKLGNDLELLPNGQVLGIFKAENPTIAFGGFGGVIKIINPDGSVDWEYEYVSNDFISHHDVEMLPNGNILFIAFERIDATTAIQFGAATTEDIFPEKLVEVNPTTNEIVWEWRSWNHIVQDSNNALENFGAINNTPERININYNLPGKADIMHANGIDYDEERDIIFLSVNHYSEIWVIDHSTTALEVATSTGGNFNKGGDLIYRFGNPSAYNNTLGDRLFHNNHFPNLLEDNKPGEGNLLVYVNGNNIQQSSVLELELPETLSLLPNTNNEPNLVWSFTDPELFSSIISGAIRLSNGNTLICEGDYGYWEITPSGEVVWKYNGIGTVKYWRGYDYNLDHPALPHLGIEF